MQAEEHEAAQRQTEHEPAQRQVDQPRTNNRGSPHAGHQDGDREARYAALAHLLGGGINARLRQPHVAAKAVEQSASGPACQYKLDQPAQHERDQDGEEDLPPDELPLGHTHGRREDNHVARDGNRHAHGFDKHDEKA